MRKHIPPMTFLVFAIIPILLASGCGGNDPGTPSTWNFLVYMDGDNDLEYAAIDDFNEMEMVGSTDDVRILVLVDRSPGYDTSNGNWTGTRLYLVARDNSTSMIKSSLLENYNELDMSDPATLRDFIVTCQTEYPAEHTVLTLWDHGNGVYPRISAKGIGWDDSTGGFPSGWNCLTTDEVALALSQARSITGQKIDLINTDACLMQMLEVAYEWRNEADYLVGSEENVPGDGNDYRTVLAALSADPGMTVEQAARMLVDKYHDCYLEYWSPTTYSAISLGPGFDTLVAEFKDFAAALCNVADLSGVHTAWEGTTGFGVPEYKDLYGFATKITEHVGDTAVVDAAATLRTAITNAVFYYRNTGSYVGKAYGLSILIPSQSQWSDYSGDNQYVTLKLSVDTDWDEFILSFVSYTGP